MFAFVFIQALNGFTIFFLPDLDRWRSLNNNNKPNNNDVDINENNTPFGEIQFTIVKTDPNANVKWGVRYYRQQHKDRN